jgi:hypothetical protein
MQVWQELRLGVGGPMGIQQGMDIHLLLPFRLPHWASLEPLEVSHFPQHPFLTVGFWAKWMQPLLLLG